MIEDGESIRTTTRHPRDITIGTWGRVGYNASEKCWILPGGINTMFRWRAELVAHAINEYTTAALQRGYRWPGKGFRNG